MAHDSSRLLEKIIEQKVIRENRLTVLLKDPHEEHALGWYMCVPACFNEALDIRLTERVDKKKRLESKDRKKRVWTQGSSFAFARGDTLYDTRNAYRMWQEALESIGLCVQVKDASPAGAMESGGNRSCGSVTFVILTPDEGRTKIVERATRTVSQDEFVRLLIEGPSPELSAQIAVI